jgi:beta-aspartyl-peptidase (threonine type)
MSKHCLVVHGGAGTIQRASMTPEQEEQYKQGLMDALVAGNTVLEAGGTSVDAIEAAIVTFEDNPLYNAGRGSVFTHEGTNEMDASIMYAKTGMAGAVAGVTHIRNPIRLARAVMDKSEHVMLCGKGAEEFARTMHFDFEPDAYFFVQQRYDQLMQIRDSGKTQMDHTSPEPKGSQKKFGTVGAVALDMHGNLAAATSTGGMTNKQFGRVGDTPIIGAGTYANNATCAVSCTGHGEFFIRAVVAYDISCLIEYKNFTLKQACDEVVNRKLVKLGGEGGLIALDAQGHAEMVFNSEGMYRGMKRQGEEYMLGIYRD